MKSKTVYPPRKGFKRTLATVILTASVFFGIQSAASSALKHETAGLISSLTGTSVSIFDVKWDSFSEARLERVRINNPPGFFNNTFAYIPEIKLRFDLPALFSGKTGLKLVRLESVELGLEKNAEGKTNVLYLNRTGTPSASPDGRFYAERFEIGPVYVHYEEPHKTLGSNFSVYARERESSITGLRDPAQMLAHVLKRAVDETSMSGLLDFKVQDSRIVLAKSRS